MNRVMMFIIVLLSLILVACSNEAPSDESNSQSNDNSAQNAVYSFNVKFGDVTELTPDNAKAKFPPAPGVPIENLSPAFDIDADRSIALLRVEMRDDELAVGESEVRRMNATLDIEIDGETRQVGCGGINGTPDDLFMTLTEVTETRLSGTLTATLTSCDDWATGEAVNLDSITITAEFTNIPYLPEE